MFFPFPLDDNELSATQLSFKQSFESSSTTTSLDLIKMRQIYQIQQNDTVTLVLPDSSTPYTFKAKYVNAQDTVNYEWTGELVSFGGDTTGIDTLYGSLLVISKENRIFGELVIDTTTYLIKDLGEGLSALVRQKPLDGSVECTMTSSQTSTGAEENSVGKNYPACPVRVLVLYTQAALDNNPDIRDIIDIAIETTKTTLSNSKIYDNLLEIQLTGKVLLDTTDWVESGVRATDQISISTDPEILTLRATHNADIVMILTDDVYDAKGFTTAVGETETAVDSAFAIVGTVYATAPHYTFTHEMAHLFGAHHEGTDICFNDGDDSGLAFAHGYIIEKGCNCWAIKKKRYRTMMAVCYNAAYPRIPYFSTPNVKYKKKTLGIADTNDNARRIRGSACRVADYIDSTYPVLLINGRREACPEENIVLQAQLWYFPATWAFEWTVSSGGFNYGSVISTNNYCSVPMPANDGDIVFVRLRVSSDNSTEVLEKIIQLQVITKDCPIQRTVFSDPHEASSLLQNQWRSSATNLEIGEIPSVTIFPNPANNTLNIEIEMDNGVNQEFEIKLRDLMGKTISLGKYDLGSSNKPKIELNTQNYASGLYWLTVSSKHFQQTFCISIIH